MAEQMRLINRTSRTPPTPPVSRLDAPVPQAALPPPNAIELRTRMLGSDHPLVDLVKWAALLPDTAIRMPSRTAPQFQAHADDGGQLCLWFPYDKFSAKSYAITHALNLWKVLEHRRKYCV